METSEILQQLERNTGKFARQAVEAAVARREEITPELLRIVEDTTERAAELSADNNRVAHLYAMFLLAQFRETRAYPLVVRLALLPGDVLDSLCGDFMTDTFGRVLASVCGGDLGPIQSLIENDDAWEWTRSAALHSLTTLVAEGQKSREEIVGYFASLFGGRLAREYSHAWDSLVSCCADLYPEELMADIEKAYEDGLVDPGFIRLGDVTGAIALGKDRVLARLMSDPDRRFIGDTVREFGSWACWDNPLPPPKYRPAPIPELAARPQPSMPKLKTGRNEPCPCGSGKKYKKCCGA